MTDPRLESWLRDVPRAKGHAGCLQTADDLITHLRRLNLPEDPARRALAHVVDVLASEVEIAVQSASHPPATMESYRFFRSLLAGAARSGSPDARPLLTFFAEDEEPWVAAWARTLLEAHFPGDRPSV